MRSHIPVSRATQSLRGRLLLIVLVAMLPMIALLLFSGHSQSRDAQAARHMRLQNSAETAEEAVGREFQFALHVLSGLAEEVDPDASHLPASFQILIDENARASQSFLSVHRADGAMLVSSAEHETVPIGSILEWRKAAYRSQRPVIGGVVFTEPSHVAVVPIILPVGRNEAGCLTIEMLLPSQQLNQILHRRGQDDSSQTILLDAAGNLVAQSVGQTKLIGSLWIPPAIGQRPSVTESDLADAVGWQVITSDDPAISDTQSIVPTLRAVLGSLVAVAIGSMLVVWSSNRLATWLHRLSQMSRNVAIGSELTQGQPDHLPLAEFEDLRRNLARADAVLRRRGVAERMALREARTGHELLVSVVNGTLEQIHVKDLELRYVLVNRAALAAGPAKRAEWQVLGKQTADLFPPELAARIEDADRRVLATGEASSFEQEYLHPGETSPRWIAMTIAPWQDAEGGVVGVVSVSRDVTADRLAQVRLRKLQAELLRATRLSAMGAMASGLAHELNQPLAAATNYLNAGNRLLARGEAGDEKALLAARGAVTDAAQQMLRAGAIVRRLRDFVDRGEVEMQPENVAELLRETCDLALSDGLPDGITLDMEVDSSVGRVLVDRTQIGQVLLNLLRNAAEAIQGADLPYPGYIHVSAEPAPNGMAIEVRDNGPGLAVGIADRLFEPFVSSKRTGMGIGLAICRTIVEGHGGKLTASAAPDGGMIFRILLPVLFPQGEIA